MFKKCLILLSLFLMLPACAGDVENALSKGYNVFLYLYTPECKYCNIYSPSYEKLQSKHNGEFSFYKINANTIYGRNLMYKYQGRFVPYVVLINKKHALHIPPECLMDRVCTEKALKDFRV